MKSFPAKRATTILYVMKPKLSVICIVHCDHMSKGLACNSGVYPFHLLVMRSACHPVQVARERVINSQYDNICFVFE